MNKLKTAAYSLGGIQAIIAAGAFRSGTLFMLQPDGSGLGLSTDILAQTPFTDFFIPGLLLFIFNGLFNAFAAFTSFRLWKVAPWLGLILGGFLLAWISAQLLMMGPSTLLQPIFLVVSLGIIALSLFFNKHLKLARSAESTSL